MQTCAWEGCKEVAPRKRYENGYSYQRKYCDDHLQCGRALDQRAGMQETDRRVDKGYVLLRRVEDGKTVWIPEHREIVTEAIGRPLRKGEQVVHLNTVRDDNRLENLGLRLTIPLAGLNCSACGKGYFE